MSRPSITLPPVLAIGFSGHRNLPDENRSREAIRRILAEWKSKVPGVVYGVSSTAAGGDLLFAETCMELNLPLRIFLPFPREKFRADFDDATWRRAEKVMAAALSVEVTGASETPDELYYECGIETVQQSRLLIALWDGAPSQGLGGTADIVAFARDQGRPVIWIHSATAVVQHLNQDSQLLHDPEMEFLTAMPDPPTEIPADTPLGKAEAWFIKVDENANRVAPQFRRLAAIPIFCTAAAALLSGRTSLPGNSSIWLGLGIVLGIMAATLPTVMRLSRRQVVWTRVRTAAEICRSCLALWRTPVIYDVVGSEVVPELAGMLTSLNFLNMSDREARRASLEEFKRLYRADRVQNQIEYFSRHADRAARKIRQYQIVTWSSVFLAGYFNLWMVLNARGLDYGLMGNWKPVISLAATTGFQIATVAGALLIVNDYQRRRDRYRELHRMLIQWDKQLQLSQTWPTVLRITSMIEKALLAELIEWRSLIRHRKVPQK
ncbi:MAG TPA: hypothetical protein VN774_04515 [Candidatus Limnocylindrales bacterium]|nr:hypothetical protein [Candidatus Limnocylindrales bacterium]